MNIGSKLVALRKSKNMTQQQLAKQIGITRSALSNYEIGTREPDFETTKKFAEFFEITVDELLDGSNKGNNTPDFATSKDKRDLKKFLEQSEVMFDGVPLSEEDVETVQNLMQRMFWRAKEKNKRKPKNDT